MLIMLFLFAAIAITLLILALWGLWRLSRKLWRAAGPERPLWRIAVVLAALSVLASPYLGLKLYVHYATLARLPKQLEVASIEFQREESWGIGGPGDNETGFIAYRLTPESADWVRRQGNGLGRALTVRWDEWRQTPITCEEERCRWYDTMAGRTGPNRDPDLMDYLNQYGFGIPVDRKWRDKVDQAIRSPGSVYSYSAGGGVTIVAPAQGMA
jgi:hypothetical protein